MVIMNIVDPTPQSPDGFYATNNPYQVNGPRGFTEFRYLEETQDLYVRLDFPGIKKESVMILLEPQNKAVIVAGDETKESKHDSSHRKYGTATGLICDCCEISNIQCCVGDGVVRLILSKKKINLHVPSLCSSDVHPLAHLRGLNPQGRNGTDPLDPAFTGPTILPHPSVLEGPKTAYDCKQLRNGGLFLRIDMPGVPNENVMVRVESDGGVIVIGQAPPAMYDSSGRNYRAKVAIVPGDYDSSRIKLIAKHGVVRLIIPPY